MGMSTHVVGFKPPDERYKQMLAAHDACREAGVEPPEAVSDFFEGVIEPERTGTEVYLPLKTWNDNYRSGFEINVEEIPDGVKILRFYNSW